MNSETAVTINDRTFDLGRADALAAFIGDPSSPRAVRTKAGVLALKPVDASPAAVLYRFTSEAWTPADVERIILYGARGGGATWSDAEALVEEMTKGKPLAAPAQLALDILSALFVGAK